jgi:DNA-binding CsgD family transcriptional regulator/tetratricopeptide (TPR) repeat protein
MQLLERETQLEALEAGRRGVEAGDGCVALVYGEAGIGKTSLVENFLAAQPESMRILRGACESLFTPRPLGPLHDIALQVGGTLFELVESAADRGAISAASLAELGSQPTIMLVEDIHWADEATLDLLKYLGRRIRQTPSLLILTYRDDELGTDHPLRRLLGDLGASAATHRIPVAALSLEAVQALARDRTVDAAELYRMTSGNPFFVTEVLAGDGGVPETVRDAVLARAAHLSQAARQVLEAAAVLGPRVEPSVLSALSMAAPATVEECFAAGMLQADGEYYAFRHVLSRETILESIPMPRRIELHRIALHLLKDSPGSRADVARLAYHADGASDAAAVLEYAPAAARIASALGAHRQAAASYLAALRYAPGLPLAQQAALLDAYADECEATDHITDAQAAQQEALKLWQQTEHHEKQGRALRRLSELALTRNEHTSMEELAAQAITALERAGPSMELAMAYSHKSRIHMVLYEAEEAVDWGTRATKMAEQLGADETLMHALNNIGTVELWHNRPIEGREKLDRSLQLALSTNRDPQAARAFYNLGVGLLVHHDHEAVMAYVKEGLDFSTKHDLDNWKLALWSLYARVLLERGDWQDAERAFLNAPGVAGDPWLDSRLQPYALRLRFRLGDPVEPETLTALRAQASGVIFQEVPYPTAVTLAEEAWLQGDLERCRQEAEPMYTAACRLQVPLYMGELGYWMWRAGAITAPPGGAAEPYATHIAGDWLRAASMWEQIGCPYERGMALMDGDEAAQLEALQIFERLGAKPIIEKLKLQLRGQGVRGIPRGPRPSTRENAFGLTARQLEVLACLVAGSTGPAIATKLSLSPRTVDHHIASILQKTGTHSRGEAVALALRENLIVSE